MKIKLRYKGGSGSGDFGHEGRPGLVGGSGGGLGIGRSGIAAQHTARDEKPHSGFKKAFKPKFDAGVKSRQWRIEVKKKLTDYGYDVTNLAGGKLKVIKKDPDTQGGKYKPEHFGMDIGRLLNYGLAKSKVISTDFHKGKNIFGNYFEAIIDVGY